MSVYMYSGLFDEGLFKLLFFVSRQDPILEGLPLTIAVLLCSVFWNKFHNLYVCFSDIYFSIAKNYKMFNQ